MILFIAKSPTFLIRIFRTGYISFEIILSCRKFAFMCPKNVLALKMLKNVNDSASFF